MDSNSTQRARNVETTSHQRQYNDIDVDATLYKRHVPAGFWPWE